MVIVRTTEEEDRVGRTAVSDYAIRCFLPQYEKEFKPIWIGRWVAGVDRTPVWFVDFELSKAGRKNFVWTHANLFRYEGGIERFRVYVDVSREDADRIHPGVAVNLASDSSFMGEGNAVIVDRSAINIQIVLGLEGTLVLFHENCPPCRSFKKRMGDAAIPPNPLRPRGGGGDELVVSGGSVDAGEVPERNTR